MSLIWKDRFFGYLLGTWMLLGLGNLITMPIRVEYLANPDFGINANNANIAFLLLVVPAIARILSTKLWGWLFDKLHFITTRNLLNLFFILGIGLFFFAKSMLLLTIAMAFVGMAMGGGKIIWSLWVTKIAPNDKASSYMSVHMALTGLRGTLAPFIGYWILSRSEVPSVVWVAAIGMLLISLSIVLFECVRGHDRLKKV
jgi:predicted MFS family arabinose efflux permease